MGGCYSTEAVHQKPQQVQDEKGRNGMQVNNPVASPQLHVQQAEQRNQINEIQPVQGNHLQAPEAFHLNVQLNEEIHSKNAELGALQEQVRSLQAAVAVLQRRLSQVAPSHADAQPRPTSSDERSDVQGEGIALSSLLKIKEVNPDARLAVTWQLQQPYAQWDGVRVEASKLTGLALSSMQVVAIPPAISALQHLTSIMLSSNKLNSLPAEMGTLTQLTCLLLDGNQLTSLPEEIGCLSQLQMLWLQDNQLTTLPAALGQLPTLRQLLASRNRLSSVPSCLGDLTSLSSLWLDGNEQLTTLPTSLYALTQLKRLRVDPHVAASLPEEVQKLAYTPLHTPLAVSAASDGGTSSRSAGVGTGTGTTQQDWRSAASTGSS